MGFRPNQRSPPLCDDLSDYLERKDFASIEEFCGLARERIVEHSKIRLKSEEYNGGYQQSA